MECNNVSTLLSNFRSIICKMVAYGEVKKKRKFQTFICSSESDHGCLLREVVADERWLQLEVRLYCLNAF